jgi:hypothetical protein
MSSTFSNLKFELIGNGEQSGTWGTTTNSNIGTAIEQAIVGMATLDSGDFTANVCTLTLANTTAAQDARALCLNIASGAVSAAGTINVPAIQKPYIVINGSSFAVTVKVSGLTGVAVPPGTRTVVYNDGTDVGNQISFLSSLTLLAPLPVASGGTGTSSTTFVNLATNVTGTLPVANGGSGASTASAARTNFGATTLGGNLFTITNPSAVTFPRFNADNTVSSLNAADFRTAIGAGVGGGTVTSVAGAGAINGLTLTGTVTTSGNITLGGTFRKNMVVIGTNTAAAANSMYVLTASLTLTLPASPSAGDFVDVSNMSGAITAVIARNSQPIMALAEDLTVDLDGAGFTLVYADATRGWVLLP